MPIFSYASEPQSLRPASAQRRYRPDPPAIVKGNTHSLAFRKTADVRVDVLQSRPVPQRRERVQPSYVFASGAASAVSGLNVAAYLVDPEDDEAAQAECRVAETQTDALVPRPFLPYVPPKQGSDVSTQVEDAGELFDFDLEVRPLLEVLVCKTVEQALTEVSREDELQHLRSQSALLEAAHTREQARVRALELSLAEERVRNAEELRVRRETVALRRELSRKVGAFMFATQAVQGLPSAMLDGLLAGEWLSRVNGPAEEFLRSVYGEVGARLEARHAARSALQEAVTSIAEGKTI